MPITYPQESPTYRAARDDLLAAELDLRTQIETVAKLRRQLPMGGHVAEDYQFKTTDGSPVKLSSLFTKDRNTLALYSLMYSPDDQGPCPMCTSMIDGLSGQARHAGHLIDLAIVSSATPTQLRGLSQSRKWADLTILSAQGTGYQTDYNAETTDGAQHPIMNIFQRRDGETYHFWGSEAYFAPVEGQPRHVDLLWPLWNLLDLTPDGRGTDWYPSLEY